MRLFRVLLLLAMATPVAAQRPTLPPCNHLASNVMLDVDAIRPGITRQQLEQHFQANGFHSSIQAEYFHRNLYFLTLRVWLGVPRDKDGRATPSPSDVVERVSKPYITRSPPMD